MEEGRKLISVLLLEVRRLIFVRSSFLKASMRLESIDTPSIRRGLSNLFLVKVVAYARASTLVDPDGISFSTDLPGPCQLLIRNSIPRITHSAALLRRHAWESRQDKSR